jgi:hypothetical protein
MTKFPLAILLFMATSSAFAWDKNSLRELNIKGHVKKLIYLSGGDTLGVSEFDLHGNTIMLKKYGEGQLRSTTYFSQWYDESGRLSGTSSGSNRWEYLYSKKGKLAQEKRFDVVSGTLKQRKIYLSNRKGQDSIILEYGGKGELVSKKFAESWEAGRKQMFWRYVDSGKKVIRDDYSYDGNHNTEYHRSVVQLGQQEEESTTEYTYWAYDDHDNWTQSKCHDTQTHIDSNGVDEWEWQTTRWMEYY